MLVLVDSVVSGAVVVAGTAVDHHHGPSHGLALGALKVHQCRPGAVGGAAAAVGTGAAVAWLVGLDAGAVLVSEVGGQRSLNQSLALASSLGKTNRMELSVQAGR